MDDDQSKKSCLGGCVGVRVAEGTISGPRGSGGGRSVMAELECAVSLEERR